MRQHNLVLFFTFALSLGFISCKKDNSPSLKNSLEFNTWKITAYNDSGIDELYYFSSYTLSFRGGSVVASNYSTNVSGAYELINNDSLNKLVLNFGTTLPFNELNDDWTIKEYSDLKISMENVSGTGDIDLLVFEKYQ